jgi:3D (Asp-Asp-Asp) domain-containing protein
MSTDQFEVIANSGLRLRSEPEAKPGNIIVTLPKGQQVTKLAEAPDSDWWQVSTTFSGKSLQGFVAKTWLSPIITTAPDGFDLPAPTNSDRIAALTLWSTFYNVHIARSGSGSNPLLDPTGRSLGHSLSNKDWCQAALQGTVSITDGSGSVINTYNFASRGAGSQVDCSIFFPRLGNSLNRSRFKVSKGKFGEGVDGFILVPFRTIAVDRRVIAIGSVLFIPAARGIIITLPSGQTATHDGYFFAADVGGAILNNHIDTFIGPTIINPFPYVKSTASATFTAFKIGNPGIIKFLKDMHLGVKHSDANLSASKPELSMISTNNISTNNQVVASISCGTRSGGESEMESSDNLCGVRTMSTESIEA